MITQPFKVIAAFGRAFPLLFSPDLRLFVLAPLAANIALLALIYIVALSYLGVAVDGLMAYVPDWLSFIHVVFQVIFAILVGILLFYSFSVGVNILAAPFMAILAEKVETKLTGKTFDDDLNAQAIMAMVGRSIQRELQKLGYFLPRFIGLFLLSFVPLVNIVAPVLLLLFSAWMLAVQYMDYAFDNNKISFRLMRETLREQPFLCWTFGFIMMLAVTIPVLNLIMMPVAVVAATLLWVSQLDGQYRFYDFLTQQQKDRPTHVIKDTRR